MFFQFLAFFLSKRNSIEFYCLPFISHNVKTSHNFNISAFQIDILQLIGILCNCFDYILTWLSTLFIKNFFLVIIPLHFRRLLFLEALCAGVKDGESAWESKAREQRGERGDSGGEHPLFSVGVFVIFVNIISTSIEGEWGMFCLKPPTMTSVWPWGRRRLLFSSQNLFCKSH